MSQTVENVLKRFKAAQQRKINWEDTYKEAQEYVSPMKENFDAHERGGRRDNRDRVFDSTAINAVDKFVNNLQSSLVPPMKKWINLVAGQQIPDEQRVESNQQLADIRESFFSALHNSNFDIQVAESFEDLSVGTGAMLIMKGTINNPFNFISVPLEELYLEEGADGRITTSFRKHKKPARIIPDTWEDAKIDDDLQTKINENPDMELTLIEMTTPAEITFRGEKVDGFKYVVIEQGSGRVIVEREQLSSPWVVFRWSVTPGEIYGRGPVLKALADIKTINKTVELILKNASLAVSGAYTVMDDGVININNIRVAPGAMIPVTANPGAISGPSIAPLPRSGDFNVAQLVIERMQTTINEMLLANPLGPVDAPVKTATEISLRQQELAKRIGSSFGRLQFELLTPLVNRCLFILEDFGLIDLSGLRVDGNFIAIEHISPLAQAQDQEEFLSMTRYAETIANLFGPQLAPLILKPDVFSKKVAEVLNVPAEIVPTDQEIQQIRQVIGQAAAAQQQGAVAGA